MYELGNLVYRSAQIIIIALEIQIPHCTIKRPKILILTQRESYIVVAMTHVTVSAVNESKAVKKIDKRIRIHQYVHRQYLIYLYYMKFRKVIMQTGNCR